MKKADNRGVSLIELLVSIALLAIVVLMASSLLDLSLRLGRKTTEKEKNRTEEMRIADLLTNGTMNSETICIGEEKEGTVIFFGKIQKLTDGTSYTGEIFFFDREKESLYHRRDGNFKTDSTMEEKLPDCGTIKEVVCQKKYLVSKGLKQLEIRLEVNGEPWSENDGFSPDRDSVTAVYTLELSRKEGNASTMSFRVSARNRPEALKYEIR